MSSTAAGEDPTTLTKARALRKLPPSDVEAQHILKGIKTWLHASFRRRDSDAIMGVGARGSNVVQVWTRSGTLSATSSAMAGACPHPSGPTDATDNGLLPTHTFNSHLESKWQGPFAAKTYRIELVVKKLSPSALSICMAEVALRQRLPEHPNIITCVAWFSDWTPTALHITQIMDLCPFSC